MPFNNRAALLRSNVSQTVNNIDGAFLEAITLDLLVIAGKSQDDIDAELELSEKTASFDSELLDRTVAEYVFQSELKGKCGTSTDIV